MRSITEVIASNDTVFWGFEHIFLYRFMRASQHSCKIGFYAHFTDEEWKVRWSALIHSGRFRL